MRATSAAATSGSPAAASDFEDARVDEATKFNVMKLPPQAWRNRAAEYGRRRKAAQGGYSRRRAAAVAAAVTMMMMKETMTRKTTRKMRRMRRMMKRLTAK